VASKDRVLLLVHKQQASCAVRRCKGMTAYTQGATICFTSILRLLGTSLGLNCYMSFQTNQASTGHLDNKGPFLTFVVIRVNMRNVFIVNPQNMLTVCNR